MMGMVKKYEKKNNNSCGNQDNKNKQIEEKEVDDENRQVSKYRP